ncbi:MAG TPA: YceI family protein [Casimicrobiaceae bacterium]|nr:YceI family protein [Casimicrobiaceae bacterium]
MRRAEARPAAVWTHALLALAASQAIAHGEDAFAEPELFRVDPELTRAEFSVAHFWVTTLHGRFARTRGTIVLDSDARSGSIDFSIDADSVDTGWPVRDDFIRGDSMFDASRFPEMRFRSTQLQFDATGLAGAAGELTMHNMTRPVAVRVERMECGRDRGGERCGVAVVSSIRRSDFGMTFGLPFVGDEIELSFQLTARRPGPSAAVSEANPGTPAR